MTRLAYALHYFRLPRHLWSHYMIRLRQLNTDLIYAPIPWGFHELRENEFDFTGFTNPRRDLAGFVQLGTAMGFQMRFDLTPGDVAGDAAEATTKTNLIHNGLPTWLLKNHADILAVDAEGKPMTALTIEHPTSRTLFERWIQAVAPILIPHSVSIQLDLSRLPTNYSDHVTRVQWPIWLRKRFAEGGVAALNAAYGTNYQRVSEVPLHAEIESQAFQEDVAEFTAHLGSHTEETLHAFLEEQGLEVEPPISIPPHLVQVAFDPADIGLGYRYAVDALVRADGTPTPAFMAKLAKRSPIYEPAAPDESEGESQTKYVLDLAGEITLESTARKSEFIDFTFSITSNASSPIDQNTPLPETYQNYLASLAAGRRATITYARHQTGHLLDALTPKPVEPHSGQTPAAAESVPSSIYEARQGISEASMALRRAAASIGMLEDVFATALDKPGQSSIQSEQPILLAINPSELEPVRIACQEALKYLDALPDLAPPITLYQYQTWYTQTGKAALTAQTALNPTLEWLRETLTMDQISKTAWSVHAAVEFILRTLDTL